MSNSNNLNSNWVLWFHDPLDNNWKLESYKKIACITSIEDYWNTFNFINNNIIENSMLFLMREGIDPLWEHEKNVNGGCWSLKIEKGNIQPIWNQISLYLCSENISGNSEIEINGISISPKKNFCIIKIWNNKNNDKIENLKKIENISYEGIIYKPHNL